MADQLQYLRSAGVSADLFQRETDVLIARRGYRLVAGLQVATGLDLLGGLPIPEGDHHILHTHNLFPNFGARLVESWPGPIVATLHNYRSWCANGLFLRKGAVCTLCSGGVSLPALRHSCYEDSFLNTIPLAISTYRPDQRSPILRRASALIAQTHTMQRFLMGRTSHGAKVVYLPGPVGTVAKGQVSPPTRAWLFAGRLTAEKGLKELLAIWPAELHLDVFGDGPERSQLEAESTPNIAWRGRIRNKDLLDQMPDYEGLIFPSLCWEGAYPIVVREAMSLGTPVVAAEGNSAADLIQDEGGGVTFQLTRANSLQSALEQVRRGSHSLRNEASSTASRLFAPEAWTTGILDVYEKVLKQHCR